MKHIDEWNDFLNEHSEYPYCMVGLLHLTTDPEVITLLILDG